MAAAESEDKGRVLVVDDERPVRQLLATLLVQEGYHVRQAGSFAEVEERLAAESFDLATLDIVMPEVDGLEVLAWLRRHAPDTGVVMATALGEVETVIEAMRQGAYSYIIKPFNLELVVAEVARAMERQRLVAENRAYQRGLEAKVAKQTQALRQAHARLQRQVRELAGRDRLVQLQMSPPEHAQRAGEEIVQVIAQAMQAPEVILYQPDADGKHLAALARVGVSVAEGGPISLELPDPLVAQVFLAGQARAGEAEMAAPVQFNQEVLGVLWAGHTPEAEEAGAALETFGRLAREAALVLRLVQMAQELESGGQEIDELLHIEDDAHR